MKGKLVKKTGKTPVATGRFVKKQPSGKQDPRNRYALLKIGKKTS